LLADSEIIEGSQRISPEDAMENPALIPTDKELVVYCTCPSDKTSRAIALKAQALLPKVDISRVKFLRGGLAAWKAKGYPVVPYDKTFHLDTGT
jgi:rhodanese-related sulfurtransferase